MISLALILDRTSMIGHLLCGILSKFVIMPRVLILMGYFTCVNFFFFEIPIMELLLMAKLIFAYEFRLRNILNLGGTNGLCAD